jgi:tRNA-specific 2-thiouridylase
MAKVLIMLSGGIDSSVAAGLLLNAGHQVSAVTFKLFNGDQGESPSPTSYFSSATLNNAVQVAKTLGIAHFIWDIKEEFQKKVVAPFISSYLAGRTPNPCVWCNQRIKFGLMLERALALGFDYIASGHYVRLLRNAHGFHLCRGVDRTKDQSYFLWGLPAKALPQILFPMGEMTKTQTKEYAKKLGLPGASAKESQEICFIPDGDIGTFIRHRASPKAGVITDSGGNLLAEHQGITDFTVGQRRGLGLGGGTPKHYVLSIDGESGRVTVGSERELYHQSIIVTQANAPGRHLDRIPTDLLGQIRYRYPLTPAKLAILGKTSFQADFASPVRAPAPGQSAIFYLREELIVGGIIDRVLK